MLTMLRLVDIVECEQVSSAAIECRLKPRLLISPSFVRNHADTPEKLLMLVMHEIHHVLLGHTKLFPTATKTQNFVFDCVINALLSRMFPTVNHTSLFTELYSDKKFPECFLRPPDDWDGKRVKKVPSGIATVDLSHRRKYAELYKALYSETGVSYNELFKAISKNKRIIKTFGKLLGGHNSDLIPIEGFPDAEYEVLEEETSDKHLEPNGTQDDLLKIDSTKPESQNDPSLIFDLVRSISEQWPTPPYAVKGRSLNSILEENLFTPSREASTMNQLLTLFKNIGDRSPNGCFFEYDEAPTSCFSSVPGFARRDLILRALGQRPLYFVNSLIARKRSPIGERVHVYVDVSASMNDILQAVYGAIVSCSAFVHETVHLFSNKVVDISLNHFKKGLVKSTGGTDVICVANHINDNQIKRACLVTDGYVGVPCGKEREILDKTILGVCLVGHGRYSTCDDLSEVCDKEVQIIL